MNPKNPVHIISESAFDLFSRARPVPLATSLPIFDEDPQHPMKIINGLKEGDSIECSGRAGSGKTEMLLNVISYFILPEAITNQKSIKIIFFDNDWKFDILRLIQIIQSKITNHLKSTDKEMINRVEMEQMIKECLNRIIIYKPKNTNQFLLTLLFLKEVFALNSHCQRQKQRQEEETTEVVQQQNDNDLDTEEIKVIMIDSFLPWYWIDKNKSFLAKEKEVNGKIMDVLRSLQSFNLMLFVNLHYSGPNRKDNEISNLMKYRLKLRKGDDKGEEGFSARVIKPERDIHSRYSFVVNNNGLRFVEGEDMNV